MIVVDPDKITSSPTLARIVRAQEAISQLHVSVHEELLTWRADVDRLRKECKRLTDERDLAVELAEVLRRERDDWKGKYLSTTAPAKEGP